MAVIKYKTIGLIPWGKESVFLIKLPRGARNAYSKVAPGSGAFVVIQISACLSPYNPRAKAIDAAPKDGVLQNVMVFYTNEHTTIMLEFLLKFRTTLDCERSVTRTLFVEENSDGER